MKISPLASLNAYGPYEHGIWDFHADKPSVDFKSSQYLFFERSLELFRILERFFADTFTEDELTNLSVLDIGCYDGWIISKLDEKFNFGRAVGIEPRAKNIAKGNYARKFYELDCKVEFLESDIDGASGLVGNSAFDVVICLGTLHHVVSTPLAIRKLKELTKDYLLLDTMVIPSLRRDSKAVLDKLNLKDIVYRDRNLVWGIAGYKFESPYFDGSTAKDRIVSIPDSNLLEMVFEDLNLDIVKDFNPEQVSYNQKKQKLRGVLEKTYLLKKTTSQTFAEQIKRKSEVYERIFLYTTTSPQILLWWLEELTKSEKLLSEEFRIVRRMTAHHSRSIHNKIADYIKFRFSKNPTSKLWTKLADLLSLSSSQKEVLLNISRSPLDKTRFEILKQLIISADGSREDFENLIEAILNSKVSDWRSFYRTAYFAACLAQADESSNLNELKALLQASNSEFPLPLVEDLAGNFSQ